MKKHLFLFYILFVYSFSIVAQQRDSRVREYLSPTRIVWQQEESCISGVNNLLSLGNGQTDLADGAMCILKSTEDKHPAILLDFGKEIQGGIQLVTGKLSSQNPVWVRIRLGESVSEAMSEMDGKNGASNDHAMRDFKIQLPWLGVTEVGNSGFRFVRIDLLDDQTSLHLKEVRAISVFRDIPYKGSFQCNDDRLNQIWKIGAYTVHLNMQEYLWDGIKRDRLVWVGDLHPEIMTVNTVFGYNEVVPKSLDLIRDITPPTVWMNGISSYSIWWLLIQQDWYRYQGDFVYLKEQQSYMTELIRFLISKLDEKGQEHLDGGRFLDWPSSENSMAIDAGLQALMVLAMRAGANLCTVLGDEILAKECLDKAELATIAAQKVVRKIQKSKVVPDVPGSKQAVALLVLAELMDPEEANNNYLAVNGPSGFSTFYGYYMLKAMAEAGNYQGAIDIIRQYWGAMLDLGATTFWEDFNMDWLENAAKIDELVPEGKKDIHKDYGNYCYKGFRHSLCHGWASGPTSWLTEYVLGIKVVESGTRVVRIDPHLGDLQWVKGSLPTPYGILSVYHEKMPDGTVKSTVTEAPSNIVIIMGK